MLDVEAIEIRAYDDCVYFDYPFWDGETHHETESHDIAEILEKMSLPRNFELDKEAMKLSYRVDCIEDGLVCDIGWLKEQLELILQYAESLLPYQRG